MAGGVIIDLPCSPEQPREIDCDREWCFDRNRVLPPVPSRAGFLPGDGTADPWRAGRASGLAGVPRAVGRWPVSAPGDTKLVGLPLHWSETNNIKWKTEIPFRGWSTPVVMGGQVWLTTATEDGQDFFAICLDAADRPVRFNEKVFHCDNPEPLGNGASMKVTPRPRP